MKKANKKTTLKKDTKKLVKQLTSKVEGKKRGRKPGVKVGPYKKHKIENLETIQKTENVSEGNNTDITTEPVNDYSFENKPNVDLGNTDNKDQINRITDVGSIERSEYSPGNSVNGSNSSDESHLLEKFVSEHGSKTEFVETKEQPKQENKTSWDDYKTDNVSFSQGQAQLISGTLLLTFCDFFFPAVILKLMTFTDPGYAKIKKNNIKLTPDQIQELKPSADIVARYVFERINPLMAFFIAMIICYGSNIASELEAVKLREKEESKNTNQVIKEREPVKNTTNKNTKKK